MSIAVTIGPKPSNHPFYNRGSKHCYYIDGIPGKKLELASGTTYTFVIESPGHPFYFTNSDSGGSEDNDILEGFPPTDRGTVVFIMPASYPTNFYYQCKIHAYMGSYAERTGTQPNNTFYLTPVLNGLVAPTSLCAPKGDSEHIYVADQIGIVHRHNLVTQQSDIFLDVREYTPTLNENYDERGLLGLCFHPNFMQNGRFFIYYSSLRDYDRGEVKPPTRAELLPGISIRPTRAGLLPGISIRPTSKEYYNCVSEFVYENGNVNYNTEKVLLRMNRDLPYHNGGKIDFGPDGHLYILVGDGGPQKDPNNNAQNLQSWFGKVLRIDVDTPPPLSTPPSYYRVPDDNPFVNMAGVLPEIWAVGFRNPWGLEFIGEYLIVTDSGYESGVGQEEVNVVASGGNYGWNIKEGSKLTPWADPKVDTSHMMDPIFAYTTADPNYADADSSVIIGGYFTAEGDYICADYSGRLIRLRFNRNGAELIETAKVGKWIRSFGKKDTQLYVLTSEKSGPKDTTGEVWALTVV